MLSDKYLIKFGKYLLNVYNKTDTVFKAGVKKGKGMVAVLKESILPESILGNYTFALVVNNQYVLIY